MGCRRAASRTLPANSPRTGSTAPGWSSPPPTTSRSTVPSPRPPRRADSGPTWSTTPSCPASICRRASNAARCRSRFPAAAARRCWRATCASRLETQLDESLGALAELLTRARARIRARLPDLPSRRRFFDRVLAGPIPGLLRRGDSAAAERELLASLADRARRAARSRRAGRRRSGRSRPADPARAARC